ncbi:MAG: tRNA (N6-threonylcarbamoyladenosine(37)-N6)-methyltransferase TrmO [Candidatus Aminicenantia bacterium]
MEIKLKTIGIVHSPFKRKEDIPKEKYAYPGGFDSVEGKLEIFKKYEGGLKDIEGFSHLIVIFIFHKSEGYKLYTKPLFDDELRGVFTTRSPYRPNPIGMTIVELVERKGNILKVKGIDMIEGTPIIDIKPYTPRDQKKEIKIGWLRDKIKGQKSK